MKIHPVFHNSLLKPYMETTAHGPNFTQPPPEIVGNEEGHYEIEKTLRERPTRNRKSTEYLVHWKGYPDMENSWLPAKELTHAKELLATFKHKHPSKEGIQVLQVQGGLKEGILSRAKPMPPRIPVKPRTSPNKPTLNPSYSQIVKTSFTPRAHDPGKPHVTTRDHQPPSISCVTTRDPGNVSGDLPRDWSPTRLLGHVNFKCATRPLIHTWQMVGTINERVGNQQSHKTPNNWGNSPMRSRHPNRRAPIEDSPTCPHLSNLSRGQNSHLLALCKPTLNYAQTTLY